MKEQLEAIRKSALDAVVETRTAVDLEAVRVRYLARRASSPPCSSRWASSPPRSAPSWASWPTTSAPLWKRLSSPRSDATAQEAMAARLKAETVDVTIPGKKVEIGHKHPHVHRSG